MTARETRRTVVIAAIVLVFAFLAGLVAGVVGDRIYLVTHERVLPRGGIEFVGRHMLHRLDRSLDLSAEQEAKVKEIIDRRTEQLLAEWDDVHATFHEELSIAHAEIAEVLTPEQRTKFDRMQRRWRHGKWTKPRLEGTEWILDAPQRATLKFDADNAGGFSGCNWYGGRYKVSRGRIQFEQFSSTAIGCPGDDEARYLGVLRGEQPYTLTADRLTIGPLSFKRRVPLNMNPKDLVGTNWRLQSEPEVTIAFTDSAISGFAGCREYTGTYRATGDAINVNSITMKETECNAPERVLVAEGEFTTHLSEATHYRLSDGTLELLTVRGRTLTFERDSKN